MCHLDFTFLPVCVIVLMSLDNNQNEAHEARAGIATQRMVQGPSDAFDGLC
jgi:hypothetical protein